MPPLRIGSVKTNIGHLEAAAGVAGVIKTVLALQQRCIPPHLHLREPNPLISWDQYPIVVPTRPTEWVARDQTPRRAAVSSFGFSGTNAHVVLEEAPAAAPSGDVRRCTAAAGAVGADAGGADRAREPLSRRCWRRPTRQPWADVAATAALGRSHQPERLAVVATSAQEAQRETRRVRRGRGAAGVARGRPAAVPRPRSCSCSPARARSTPAWHVACSRRQPEFRQALEECDRLLAPLLPRPLLAVMFGDGDDAALLNDTAYTQPALFAVEYALAQLWRSWGVEPTAVMGHSVGEYVAACLAGVFSLEDGLRLIAERGRLMSALPRDGSMAAVFADEARVRAALAGHDADVSIAAVNGPQSIVISGRTEVVDALLQQFASEGVEAQRLNVSHAFHSPLMDPILDRFEAVAATVQFSPPRIGVVSNVTGRLAERRVVFAGVLARASARGGAFRRLDRHAAARRLPRVRRGRADADAARHGAALRGRERVVLDRLAAQGPRRRGGDAREPRPAARAGSADSLDRGARRRRRTAPHHAAVSIRSSASRTGIRSSRATSRASLAPTRSRHPLLGGVVASPLHIFQSEIGVRLQPWLADHRIFDFTLFPATGFLEMAHGGRSRGARRRRGGRCAISSSGKVCVCPTTRR